jgi:peptide-methionine (R)-S-oxide reductase
MKRRSLIAALVAVPAGILALRLPAATRSNADIARMQASWAELLPADFKLPDTSHKLVRSEQEWRQQLSPAQFEVLREEGTERPFSSALNDEKGAGLFVCAGCEAPLFSSEMKYDSGTGWPSFVTSIPGALETKRDFKLVWPRTEYHCSRCGGHQGHVFDDGPEPTGQRWCNNGVALQFVAASAR